MSLIVVSQPVGTLRLERFMSVSEREEAERVRRANCCKRRLCIYCTRIILDDSGVCEWCKKAFDEGKQDSHPPCTPSTRCIICAECEAKILDRQKEKDTRVAEKWCKDGWGHLINDSAGLKCSMPGHEVAQAIREAE